MSLSSILPAGRAHMSLSGNYNTYVAGCSTPRSRTCAVNGVEKKRRPNSRVGKRIPSRWWQVKWTEYNIEKKNVNFLSFFFFFNIHSFEFLTVLSYRNGRVHNIIKICKYRNGQKINKYIICVYITFRNRSNNRGSGGVTKIKCRLRK